MTPEEFQQELDRQNAERQQQQDKTDHISAVNNSGEKVVNALKGHTEELTGSIHDLLMATLVSKDPNIAKTAKNLANLLGEIKNATADIKGANFKPLADNLESLKSTLETVPQQIEEAHKATDPTPLLADIAKSLGQKNWSPNISVKAPPVDVTPLEKILSDIKQAISDNGKEFDTSKLDSTLQDVVSGIEAVRTSIDTQQFPVPNYVLPFKDSNGKAVQVQLDASGNIPTTGGGGGGGGAVTIADGADVAQGSTGDAAYTSGSGTVVSVLKGIFTKVANALTVKLQDGSGNSIGSTSNALDINIKSGNPTSITANAGTNLNTSALALDATLTGGTQKAIARGGAKGTTAAADVTSTASGSNHQPIDVAIYDASGNQITSFGGGTQYADGAARGTATGTIAMVDDGTNIQSAKGDTDGTLNNNTTKLGGTAIDTNSGSKSAGTQRVVLATDQPQLTNPLKVDGSGATQPVSGTVTANAGTGPWPVTDNGGSLTVDAPVGTPAFVRLSDGTNPIATLPVSLSSVPSHNVTNAGVFAVQASLTGMGTVSTANSTTSNLTGGAAFTGTSEDVSGYAAIQVSVFSSHVSATDGLSLQQSSDGTNWDIADVYTIPATTGKVFSVQPAAKFFRLVYTNGATTTTSLRIMTVYHVEAPNPSSQRTSDAYTNETDLTQQWTFNSIFNGTTWDRISGGNRFGDGNAATGAVLDAPILFNGSTFDRLRSITNGTNSTGTGISAAGILGQFDDVSPTSITENQFGNVRMSANRNLYGTIRDAAGNERGANVTANNSLQVAQQAATATLSNVASSATSVTLLSSNTARIGGSIYNDSTQVLYVKFGTTASSSSFNVLLAAGGYFEINAGYTGRIDGIWASANGNARINEIT